MDFVKLDEWYEEKKRKIQEIYEAKVKKKENPEKSKKYYKVQMSRLRKKYESLHQKILEKEARKQNFHHFITRKMRGLRSRIERIKEWYEFRFKKHEQE